MQAGDYPDPSVIRVGKDYYATATSSEWGPEYPILHSTDLVNWSDVETVSAGGGPVVRDLGAIAGIPKKFYRAIQAP